MSVRLGAVVLREYIITGDRTPFSERYSQNLQYLLNGIDVSNFFSEAEDGEVVGEWTGSNGTSWVHNTASGEVKPTLASSLHEGRPFWSFFCPRSMRVADHEYFMRPDPIGKGGYGTVYEFQDTRYPPWPSFAVKFIVDVPRDSRAGQFTQNGRQEASMVNELNRLIDAESQVPRPQPLVVSDRVRARVLVESMPFMGYRLTAVAMECAEGSLRSLAPTFNTHGEATVALLGRAIFDELRVLFTSTGGRMLHGDVKLENFLYTRTNRNTMRVMLADLGALNTYNGRVQGGMTYVSPWFAMNSQADVVTAPPELIVNWRFMSFLVGLCMLDLISFLHRKPQIQLAYQLFRLPMSRESALRAKDNALQLLYTVEDPLFHLCRSLLFESVPGVGANVSLQESIMFLDTRHEALRHSADPDEATMGRINEAFNTYFNKHMYLDYPTQIDRPPP